MRLALHFCLIIAATAATAQRSGDTMLSNEALQDLLSGRVLEFFDGSKSRYGADGRYGYTYTDDGPVWTGDWRMEDGSRICVEFDNGSARCDMIVMDGERPVLIIEDGTRFPIRNLTVDEE